MGQSLSTRRGSKCLGQAEIFFGAACGGRSGVRSFMDGEDMVVSAGPRTVKEHRNRRARGDARLHTRMWPVMKIRWMGTFWENRATVSAVSWGNASVGVP